MHYLYNDIIIKSENAAKSSKQRNRLIEEYIRKLDKCNKILDYGCGKCRYSDLLMERTEELYLLDSVFQTDRYQIIDGKRTTVRQYASQYNNVYVINDQEVECCNLQFDFVLCTNVLSSIPIQSERVKVLNNIRYLLKDSGKALVSVQYRNSYFNTYKMNKDNMPVEDGWIIKKGNSYSFYGIILPDKLFDLCQNGGLEVCRQINHEGSSFVLCKKPMCG